MVQNIEVTIAMDLIKQVGHASDRAQGIGRENIEGYEMRPADNSELKYFVDSFKKDIAEKIITGEIQDGVPFVIKSVSKQLAIPLKPLKVAPTYWRLIISTVWRESASNPFRVFKGQLVMEK